MDILNLNSIINYYLPTKNDSKLTLLAPISISISSLIIYSCMSSTTLIHILGKNITISKIINYYNIILYKIINYFYLYILLNFLLNIQYIYTSHFKR